ncbi:hypothetical protein N431DRAFT_561178 [Stipitochalara longipes BDJ]|nr:hypothetical protein N431DRAFT_561178 [Stipitochalara longipes BDJ]
MREIAEYKRIIQFSEQVLAGTHPRVKIPSHLLIHSKPDHQAAAPPPYQKKPPTTHTNGMDYWSVLGCKRKREELEDVMEADEAEDWNEPAEDAILFGLGRGRYKEKRGSWLE